MIWGHEECSGTSRHMSPVLSGHRKIVGKQKQQQPPPPPDSNNKNKDFFLKGGRKIHVGNCALFQSGNSPPFIGIICWFSSGKESHLNIGVNWLYRPADVKLANGTLHEAAPNEVFYSFHKDEISAESLLHPCKVAFLHKGVELPSGIFSFVCRRIYDVANQCLWWLTDLDYIKERQEEVDQLLGKTQKEMHTAIQSGGHSPKQSIGPSSTQKLQSGSDGVHNISTTSISLQGKWKKKEKVEQVSGTFKDHSHTPDNGDSSNNAIGERLKSEVTKITDKGALINIEGVDKLLHLMQADKAERKIDLAGRILLADVIASTNNFDCLGRFVQLRGVLVLYDWLQEAHKGGKIGDGGSRKESDKFVDEFLLVLLRALDKLPVNLHALQTSNIGKSVNHLRSHKNLEIHRKARNLVDMWKKRVDAEMMKIGHGDPIVKLHPASPESSKLPLTGSFQKDVQCKVTGISGTSELHFTAIKEEKSSGSSQSQNNSQSCSSGHAKTLGTSWKKEDAKVSTARSKKVSKASGVVNFHKRSNNGFPATGISGAHKEANFGRNCPFNQNSISSRVSQPGLTSKQSVDLPASDHGNGQRLIVRLPNPGRSLARSTSGGESVEKPSTVGSGPSSPSASEKKEQNYHTKKIRGHDSQTTVSVGANTKLWQINDTKGAPVSDDAHKNNDENGKAEDVSKAACSSSANEKEPLLTDFKLGKSCDPSISSINVFIESCVKNSKPKTSLPGDDIGVNLLASVATGEMCKTKLISPITTLQSSPMKEDHSNATEDKFGCSSPGQHDDIVNAVFEKHKSMNLVSDESLKLKAQTAPTPQEDKSTCEHNELSMKLEGKPDKEAIVRCEPMLTIAAHMKEDDVEIAGANKLLEKMKPGMQSSDDSVDSKHSVRSSSLERLKSEDCAQEMIADSVSNFSYSSLEGTDDKAHAISCKTSLKEEGKELQLCPSDMDVEHTVVVNEESLAASIGTGDHLSGSSGIKPNDVMCGTEDKPNSSSSVVNSESMKKVTPGNTNNSGNEQVSHAPPAVDHCVGLIPCTSKNVSHKNEVHEHLTAVSAKKEMPRIPIPPKVEQSAKNTSSRLPAQHEADEMGLCLDDASSLPNSVEPDSADTRGFDLNEGISDDNANQGETAMMAPLRDSPVGLNPVLKPITITPTSSGSPFPGTVAASARSPFIPLEKLLVSKGGLGWKGSAATSAFRPVEPRKVIDMPLTTSDATRKQTQPALDIDLNVADEQILENIACLNSVQEIASVRNVGLDLDLNKADEITENGQLFEKTFLPVKSAFGAFTHVERSVSRNFDLNTGPCFDELGQEPAESYNHHTQNTGLPAVAPFGLRMNNTEQNAYSAVSIPSFIPDRRDQAYPIVTPAGAQKFLGSTAGDKYRNHMLSSSPAMIFSPAPSFSYASFPFRSSFPFASVSPYVRPDMMRLQGCSTSSGGGGGGSEDSKKWDRQSLDLNAGPGSIEVEEREESLPSSSHGFAEEHARRVYQVANGGLKRKDPEGGWEAERCTYKLPSWAHGSRD